MADTLPDAEIPDEFTTLAYPLPHLADALQRSIKGNGPVKIVAMGSSSTAGRLDVVPYPHRLEQYLRAKFDDPDRFRNGAHGRKYRIEEQGVRRQTDQGVLPRDKRILPAGH